MACVLPETDVVSAVDERLASRIVNHDPAAIEEFYGYLIRKLRSIVVRRLPEQDPSDILHETFTVSLESIQNGQLRNPDAIRAYVHAILNRTISARIEQVIRNRNDCLSGSKLLLAQSLAVDAESSMICEERIRLMMGGMNHLLKRDMELLTHFYLNGQPYRDICREMNLTEPQFRRFKHRAKAKLKAIISR